MKGEAQVSVLTACRAGCGACCIAPSISSAIPGMPNGKPAGQRCSQLSSDNLCLLFGDERRPSVCCSFEASPETCRDSPGEALAYLGWLEGATAPGIGSADP